MTKETVTLKSEQGTTMAEYAFVLSVITFLVVASFSLLSDAIAAALAETVEIVESVV